MVWCPFVRRRTFCSSLLRHCLKIFRGRRWLPSRIFYIHHACPWILLLFFPFSLRFAVNLFVGLFLRLSLILDVAGVRFREFSRLLGHLSSGLLGLGQIHLPFGHSLRLTFVFCFLLGLRIRVSPTTDHHCLYQRFWISVKFHKLLNLYGS